MVVDLHHVEIQNCVQSELPCWSVVGCHQGLQCWYKSVMVKDGDLPDCEEGVIPCCQEPENPKPK